MTTNSLVQSHGESVLPSGYALAFAQPAAALASWLMCADDARSIALVDRGKPGHKSISVSVSGCRGRT